MQCLTNAVILKWKQNKKKTTKCKVNIYINHLDLVYCLLIYFTVIVKYDIPYGSEQKHVLLFRKSTLSGCFNLRHITIWILLEPYTLILLLLTKGCKIQEWYFRGSFLPSYLSFCTYQRYLVVKNKEVQSSQNITLWLTLNLFNYKIWLDCCLFFYYQTPNIFWIVILHNINDSPMRVEEEWVCV